MEIDAPASTESNVVPDYESDSEQTKKDDKNELAV